MKLYECENDFEQTFELRSGQVQTCSKQEARVFCNGSDRPHYIDPVINIWVDEDDNIHIDNGYYVYDYKNVDRVDLHNLVIIEDDEVDGVYCIDSQFHKTIWRKR